MSRKELQKQINSKCDSIQLILLKRKARRAVKKLRVLVSEKGFVENCI